jgi:hypothetical protein
MIRLVASQRECTAEAQNTPRKISFKEILGTCQLSVSAVKINPFCSLVTALALIATLKARGFS